MASPDQIAAEYLNRSVSIDIGDSVRRGADLVRDNLGLLVGAFALSMVLSLGMSAVPMIGWIAAFFLNHVVAGGLALVFIRRIRGDRASVFDVFTGFSEALFNLAAAGALATVLIFLGFVLLILPGVYLAVCYGFAVPLVIDKKYEYWTAMEVSRRVVQKHWWKMFALMIVVALLFLVGAIALFVGVFLTGPIAIAAYLYAYQTLFGDSVVVGV